MRSLIFLAFLAASTATATPVDYTHLRLAGNDIGLSVVSGANACAAACKEGGGCKGWSYCQDPAGCDASMPAKTCILLAFKKPAFSGRCPASAAEMPAWASGVADHESGATAQVTAQAYCDKQLASAVKRGVVPVLVDVEVLPEAAG